MTLKSSENQSSQSMWYSRQGYRTDSRHHEHNSRVRLQCYGHRLHLTISWCLNGRGMNGLAGQCKGSQNYFISPLQYSRASWHHCMFPEYFAAVAHNLVCTHTYTDTHTDTGLSIFVNFTSALLCLYYVCVCPSSAVLKMCVCVYLCACIWMHLQSHP